MDDSKHAKWWNSPWTVGLVCNVICLAVGGFVTYLTHEGSAWVKPVLFGALAWIGSYGWIQAIRWGRRMPPRVEPITTANIHVRIRDWFDRYELTVKSIKSQDSHFFFIVTTDSGKRITVNRRNDKFTDYIEVKGLISAGETELKDLEMFNEDEKLLAELAIQLELSRSVMGYKADKSVLEEITIFKRIPISPAMHEEDVVKLVWEIEAMLGSIFIVALMAAHRNKVNRSGAEG